jgi:hypothetical protein
MDISGQGPFSACKGEANRWGENPNGAPLCSSRPESIGSPTIYWSDFCILPMKWLLAIEESLKNPWLVYPKLPLNFLE